MTTEVRGAYPMPEAAAYCGVSRETLRQAIRRGDIPTKYSGTKPLILRTELDKWLEALPDTKAAS